MNRMGACPGLRGSRRSHWGAYAELLVIFTRGAFYGAA